MNLLEKFFRSKEDFVPCVTGDGSLGEIIQEVEADFLERWLEKIERSKEGGKTLTEKERKVILERDGHRCVIPHCKTPTYRLNVHHLIWRQFGGLNNPENLVTLDLEHHMDCHPGLRDTFKKYRLGDKNAFKEYMENNKRWEEQPVTRIGDLATGIIYERTRNKRG